MITTDFLSTVSFKQHLHSLYCITFWILWLEQWKENKLLIQDLETYFWNPEKDISLFYNARTALYQYLLSLNLQHTTKKEVILSWYNCVSVSNAIIQAWYTPVYTDIETTTLGMDITALEKNISENTWVILLQHSFWVWAKDTEKIIQLAKEKGIIVIEDVAHSLWAEIKWKKLWLFWDAAIFSTWRDKVISSVNWAFLLENKQANKKTYATKKLPNSIIIKNHLYNILGYFAFKTYHIWPIGKIIMLISKQAKLFPDILTKAELASNEKQLDYSLPNSLAYLIRKELDNIDIYINKRGENSKVYQKNNFISFKNIESNYFRTLHLCKNTNIYNELYNYMKRNWVLLWNSWSEKNIAPKNTNIKWSQYILWSCPVAEDIASRIVFLPNAYNRNADEIEKIVTLLNKFYSKNV